MQSRKIYRGKKKKTIRKAQSTKSKQKQKQKQTIYNKTKKLGSGPKKGNVQFGENQIIIYDNRDMDEEIEHPEPVPVPVPMCPDFRYIRSTHFPCKYHRTVFENMEDYNDWMKMQLEKNKGLNKAHRFLQIRNHLERQGMWSNRSKPTHIPMTPSVPSSRPGIRSPMPMVMPMRFRKNVDPRITQDLSDNEVV